MIFFNAFKVITVTILLTFLFQSCGKQNIGSREVNKTSFIDKGKYSAQLISINTQLAGVRNGELQMAIENGGISVDITFRNGHAFTLITQYSSLSYR